MKRLILPVIAAIFLSLAVASVADAGPFRNRRGRIGGGYVVQSYFRAFQLFFGR